MERKSESIILRVTKEEKDSLMTEAKKKKKTLSRYLVESGLVGTDMTDGIPMQERIEVCDFLNEIYHKARSCGNKELENDIKALYQDKVNILWGQKK